MPCWIIPSVAKVHTHEGWTCYSPGPSLPPPLTSLTQFNRLIPTPLINFNTVIKTKLLQAGYRKSKYLINNFFCQKIIQTIEKNCSMTYFELIEDQANCSDRIDGCVTFHAFL